MKKFKFLGALFYLLNILAAVSLLIGYAASHISPSFVLFPAFFGLALPALILLNVLFLIGWMVVGRIRFVLSLIVLILGYQSIPKMIQLNKMKEASPDALKIMSHNVRLFDLYMWQEDKHTRNDIFQLIRTEKADILCLQEFYFSQDKTYEFKTLDSLMTFPNITYKHDEYSYVKGPNKWGIATFSKYPILNRGRVKFEDGEHNICIYTDIQTEKEIIRVYNMHLASIKLERVDYKTINDVYANSFSTYFGNEKMLLNKLKEAFQRRETQVNLIKESIAKSPYKVIVCGDLNDTPTSYAYQTLAKDLKDSFLEAGRGFGQTYIGKFPSFRIDYILHSEGLVAEQFFTLPEKLSDHHPIVAYINWDKAKSTDQE